VRAWRVHAFGGIPAVSLDEVPPPNATARQVLIRVVAASLNPADILITRGLFPRITDTDLPVTLGCDFVGIVERGAAGAERFQAGEAVYGLASLRHGSFAEYVVAEPETLARVADSHDLSNYAAIPLAALTAWQGLVRHGVVRSGQRVLILGAAGGVGHYAVQIAHEAGATVYATGSDSDAGFLRNMGADKVIDRDKPLAEECADIDLVLDLVGGSTQDRAWQVLNNNGAIVSAVSPPDERLGTSHSRASFRFVCQPDRGDFEQVARLVQTGRLRPSIASSLAFEQVPEALQLLDKGGTRGKIIITC
jgi:NADPH:quinone reductase-like Zn-dependent oxidoreductase